jgi:predicted  nucleic acid-binding Zn-ribbon protein
MNTNKVVEEIVDEILHLARKKPLSDRDLARAKELMMKLREMGFTNKEISELTQEGWKEPTVKLYTRGVAVKDPSPKEDTTKLLTQLVSVGLTLDDVETSVSMKSDLDAKSVSFEDVSSLLEEAKRFKVGVKELMQTYRDLKDSGLSIGQLSEALSYKSDLTSAGFTPDNLKKVYEASKTYGGYGSVLEAINAYASLKTIEADARTIGLRKNDVEKQVSQLEMKVDELKEKQSKVEEALRIYDELKSLGFDEATLKQLKLSSDRYGGVKGVLDAINTYRNLIELKDKVVELEKKKLDIDSQLKSVQAKYAHLQTVIGMCDTLLYKYKFSVPAITDIYDMAKKFGEPIEAIKAIGRYGDLKTIEGEIEKFSNRKSELESRVNELEKQIQGLRATAEEVKSSANGLLKPLASEIGRSTESMKEAFMEATRDMRVKYQESFDILGKMFEEYATKFGELKAEAGRLEEELKLARIVNTLMKYPSEAKELPFDYALLLHDAVYKFCLAKGVNPKVMVGDETAKKYSYPFLGQTKMELIDLINWTKKGLEAGLGGSEA